MMLAQAIRSTIGADQERAAVWLSHLARGNILKSQGRYEEALESLDRAVKLAPRERLARYCRAQVLFTLGRFTCAYEDLRPAFDAVKEASRGPWWFGEESIAGKALLVRAENGLGDTVQFCRYVGRAAAAGARVIAQTQRPLMGLLSSLEGVSEVAAVGDPEPDFDRHSFYMGLPFAFGTELATIPAARSYLSADPARVAMWRERLGERRGPRVGLVWWTATPPYESNLCISNCIGERGIPIADLIAHLPPGFQYVSLQRHIRDCDRAALDHSPIEHVASELDLDDTAAVMECMDLVVSIDTSLAHLAGALGRPTWIALTFIADWRWFHDCDDSPWYPTARLYRQRRLGEWREPLEQMSADLRRGPHHFARPARPRVPPIPVSAR